MSNSDLPNREQESHKIEQTAKLIGQSVNRLVDELAAHQSAPHSDEQRSESNCVS